MAAGRDFRHSQPAIPGGFELSDLHAMPRYDFSSPRLYVAPALGAGAAVPLDAAQGHYLVDVLRLKPGDSVLVFNGRDGEWRAALARVSKKALSLTVLTPTRAQTEPGDLHYLFAPLKRARLDYLVQKAVEMGVAKLMPVLTRHTQAERINLARMRANAIEAAEQCGILSLPAIAEPMPLPQALAALEPGRLLVFCDESAEGGDAVAALTRRRESEPAPRCGRDGARASPPVAVLIGPEGGFTDDERAAIVARPNTLRIALGPRILRADTAAVAALTLVQATLGDWR